MKTLGPPCLFLDFGACQQSLALLGLLLHDSSLCFHLHKVVFLMFVSVPLCLHMTFLEGYQLLGFRPTLIQYDLCSILISSSKTWFPNEVTFTGIGAKISIYLGNTMNWPQEQKSDCYVLRSECCKEVKTMSKVFKTLGSEEKRSRAVIRETRGLRRCLNGQGEDTLEKGS